MKIRVVGTALLVFGGLLAGGHAAGAPASVTPLCVDASHSVLKVQAGRDVCAPTVLANGKAVAVGFLPTTCPPEFPELVVDAVGPRDLCRPRAAAFDFNLSGRG